MVKAPTPEEEHRRRLCRERKVLLAMGPIPVTLASAQTRGGSTTPTFATEATVLVERVFRNLRNPTFDRSMQVSPAPLVAI
jgi:hypothetical protein